MLKAWIEWKERCALDLCSAGAQKMLNAFAGSRFDRCIERCSTASDSPRHERPWHLFETYATVTETKQGKRYKDWIFARVAHSNDDPIDVIQGGATLIMRDAVREFALDECSPGNTLSLNRPMMAGDSGSVTLLDILPAQVDPFAQVCLREYERLAREHAGAFLADMSDRERVAVMAREAGIALSRKGVERVAGCKKSVLSAAYRDAMARIVQRLQADYRDDDPESILVLALMVVRQIGAMLLQDGAAERLRAVLSAPEGERCLELAEA